MNNNEPLDAAMDNLLARRLGEIATQVGGPRKDVGDPIDRGLILLRLLNEEGFDVAVRATPSPEPPRQTPELRKIADEIQNACGDHHSLSSEYYGILAILDKHFSSHSEPELSIQDYEEVLADKRRLVRELDVIWNGEAAAEQASLCDIVAQIQDELPELRRRAALASTPQNENLSSGEAK